MKRLLLFVIVFFGTTITPVAAEYDSDLNAKMNSTLDTKEIVTADANNWMLNLNKKAHASKQVCIETKDHTCETSREDTIVNFVAIETQDPPGVEVKLNILSNGGEFETSIIDMPYESFDNVAFWYLDDDTLFPDNSFAVATIRFFGLAYVAFSIQEDRLIMKKRFEYTPECVPGIQDECDYVECSSWETIYEKETSNKVILRTNMDANKYSQPVALCPDMYEYKFKDIHEHLRFEKAINYIADRNIVSGYPDGTYRPDNPINRAEFTKIIIGAMGAENGDLIPLRSSGASGRQGVENESKYVNCFPDVEEQWFAEYVCKAKELGIISGYPDGEFKPGENVNIAEAAKIVTEAFQVYADVGDQLSEDPEWYELYIATLKVSRVFDFMYDDVGRPLTRGGMADMIWRMLTMHG